MVFSSVLASLSRCHPGLQHAVLPFSFLTPYSPVDQQTFDMIILGRLMQKVKQTGTLRLLFISAHYFQKTLLSIIWLAVLTSFL